MAPVKGVSRLTQKPEVAKWDISSVLAIAHPSGSPRSEQFIDQDSMGSSAKLILQALTQAIQKGTLIIEDHLILMGASAGGAVAIELAALLSELHRETNKENIPKDFKNIDLSQLTAPDLLILQEAAGISSQPDLLKHAALSKLRSVLLTRKKGEHMKDTIRRALDGMLISGRKTMELPKT